MIAILLVQATGCSTVLKDSGTLERHAIIVNKAGKPYLPIEPSNCTTGNSNECEDSREWSTNEEKAYLAYDEYLDGMISLAKKHFDKKEGVEGVQKKLLLYIHGGLNQREDSNERATKLVKQIKEEMQGEYYPISVNWNSALFSSYGEHLISVRQGNTDPWAWVTSPIFLATDLGRGLIRAPVVWGTIVENDLTSWLSNKDNRDANKIAQALNNATSDEGFPHWFGAQVPPTLWKDQVWGSTTTALSYPIKLFSSPWIDALGKSAWENMLRRTGLLFHAEKDFQVNSVEMKASQLTTISYKNNHNAKASTQKKFEKRVRACQSLIDKKEGLVHEQPSGALSIFFRELAEEILKDDYSKWSITLVGHSMGAIIVNHILRDFGACLPIDNIVLMAAASTINSYNDSVFPFMELRQRENMEYETSVPKVYHLMLHELAETSETNYWNLPPTGSLLVWIDNFLSTPHTIMDRTSGRFTNFMLSLHTTPEEMRPYISIKRFPGGGSSWGGVGAGIPKNHSDFSGRFRFWKEECWKPPTGTTPNEKFDNEKKKNCFY